MFFCSKEKRLLVALALALPLAAACKQSAAPSTITSSEISNANFASVTLDPSGGNLQSLLAAEAARASARGLKPFVEVRADWCGPCRKLEAAMTDARMVDAFTGTYQIRLDADAWQSQFAGSGIRADAIPVFYELDASGKPTGRSINGGAWGEDIPENIAPPLKSFFHPM